MITRFVKMTFQPEYTGEFEEVFSATRPGILQFPGCRKVELFTDTQNPCTYFTISHWDSEEHLDHYRSSDFFRATWSKVKPMFSARPEAWSLQNPTRQMGR